jgi:hypothetical protein
MTDIVERLRAYADSYNWSRAGLLPHCVLEAADEIERLTKVQAAAIQWRFQIAELETENAEILQAHTALVERLHDVTTMLEGERAENARLNAWIIEYHKEMRAAFKRDNTRADKAIANAPVAEVRCRDAIWILCPKAGDMDAVIGKRVALVVVE